MEKNIRISAVVGIDPGSNGGIVTWRPNHNITAIKMPEDINDIRDYLNHLKTICSPIVFLEKLSTYDVQKQGWPSQETGYGTTDQNKSKAVIVVASGIRVKITLENVNIENLQEDEPYCALYADEAQKVELTLAGDNSLVGGHDLPAICAYLFKYKYNNEIRSTL